MGAGETKYALFTRVGQRSRCRQPLQYPPNKLEAMRSARFFLACAAVSLLAACGTDPVAPAAPEAPHAPRLDTSSGTPDGGQTNSTSTSGCSGTVQVVTNPDGSTTLQCVVDENKQNGSGG